MPQEILYLLFPDIPENIPNLMIKKYVHIYIFQYFEFNVIIVVIEINLLYN